MILQALKEYYDRKPDLPREGWERKAIPFLVVIKENGDFVCFQDTRESDGKRLRAKEFLVPSLGEKKGNGIKANFFWENIEYLFGIPVATGERKPDPERVREQHSMFRHRVEAIVGDCGTLRSVRSFLERIDVEAIQRVARWQDVLDLNQSLLLAIEGRGPVTDDAELRNLIDVSRTPKGVRGRCLVTGEEDEIVVLEPPIRGVRGANPMGASLVSVNNKVSNGVNAGAVPAFSSFSKEQGRNSPIGKSASFAYTTVLNHLLRSDSRQRIQIGDATTIFWSAKDDNFEMLVADFFGEPPKDDPDRLVNAVKNLYKSAHNGAYVTDDNRITFYVLGLSPNAARIAVRFWLRGTVAEIAAKVRHHFDDIRIAHGPKDKDAVALFRLLVSTATQGKAENIPPNLAGDTIRAILEGLPYPQTLLQAAIRRIRVEQGKKDKITGKLLPNVTYERASLIKACLNRKFRSENQQTKEELKVSLDTVNMNIGYRLGRLFAALEKIQIRKFTQNGGKEPNSTIRDKFYGAASGTPASVFGTLIRLSKHHLAGIENVGERINCERLIGEIMSGIADFPPHLKLDDQGRFAIGYYHQMQDFYTKKEKQDQPNKEKT
ncbi:MAG: type I-C CRISPR-associated protein Cas8c/Csd1 [bacterium]